MEPPFRNNRRSTDVLHLLRQRHIDEKTASIVPRKLQVANNFIDRLGLERQLIGHKGCVNCLEWSENGRILASSSDDMNMILWDAFRYEKVMVRNTGHNGNVFSIKFLPKTNDNMMATGAADSSVRVHDILGCDTVLVCTCHNGRVKRLATARDVPSMFWSASEDGLIIQYDMRTKHTCKSTTEQCVLVNLNKESGVRLEAKCIAVNSKRPEMIAVGANDAYVRLYDRRMIKLSQIPVGHSVSNGQSGSNVTVGNSDTPVGCVQYFISGHFKLPRGIGAQSLATTYLTFSPAGDELLSNLGGENIYLFDIDHNKHYNTFVVPQFKEGHEEKDEMLRKTAYGVEICEGMTYKDMNIENAPKNIQQLKMEGNEAFMDEKYSYAIHAFNKAIELCPNVSILYGNRAACFMKRRWDGDRYASVRDSRIALLLDPCHTKTYFRLCRALSEMGAFAEALRVITDFEAKFPFYEDNESVQKLKEDVEKSLELVSNFMGYNCGAIHNMPKISPKEQMLRDNSKDYRKRYYGHCNTTTDIKEANFFGADGEYIIAGSDDGAFFVWDRHTTNIVRILRGDDKIVNCLQPHPTNCLLATSGIEPVVKLWSPLAEDQRENERLVDDTFEAASANQIRMKADPFDLLVRNIAGIPNVPIIGGGEEREEPEALRHHCRTS